MGGKETKSSSVFRLAGRRAEGQRNRSAPEYGTTATVSLEENRTEQVLNSCSGHMPLKVQQVALEARNYGDFGFLAYVLTDIEAR